VDGQSYLLLIRDEGGPPELQVHRVPYQYLPVLHIKKSFLQAVLWIGIIFGDQNRHLGPADPGPESDPDLYPF
jgi:hypothetical protein